MEDGGSTLLTTRTLTFAGKWVVTVVTFTLELACMVPAAEHEMTVVCTGDGSTGGDIQLVTTLVLGTMWPSVLPDNFTDVAPGPKPTPLLPELRPGTVSRDCPLCKVLVAFEKRLCRLSVLKCPIEAFGTVTRSAGG